MNSLLKNKKGQTGLVTAKAFILVLLTVAVIGFVAVVVLGNLGDTKDIADIRSSAITQTNVTTTYVVNETGVALGERVYLNAICTVTNIQNNNSVNIIAANYTASDCRVRYSNAAANLMINNTAWGVTYTYTYAIISGKTVTGNVTSGLTTFFSNTGVWFSLLAVVIIILIVSIVIYAVNRFGGGEGSSRIAQDGL